MSEIILNDAPQGDAPGDDPWDDNTPLILPRRSRLVPIAPVGVATAVVESLTSYVARLAAAHAVPLSALVHQVVAPILDPDGPWWGNADAIDTFLRRQAYALNGLASGAAAWTTALATLTLRHDLRALTLLPWAGVLSPRGLLRTTSAWCPECYAAQRDAGTPVYQPLLWWIAPVKVCIAHGRALATRCPRSDCGRIQPSRAGLIIGHCVWCGYWLGESGPRPAEDGTGAEDRAWHRWAAVAVGELLAAGPTLSGAPSRDNIAVGVARCVALLGSNSAVARAVGLPVVRVSQWRQGRELPSLPYLLRFCYRLQITPLQLLGASIASIAVVPEVPGEQPVSPGPSSPVGTFDVTKARVTLRAALDAVGERADEPPSVLGLARLLGCTPRTLHRHCPDECRAIGARWLAYRQQHGREVSARRCEDVRRAVAAVHRQGHFPTAAHVKTLLDHPHDLRRADARAAWHEALRGLERAGGAAK